MGRDVGAGERFVELDGLRGIAAGSVVLYHLFHEYDVYFQPGVPPPRVQFSMGFYGVQLFFLISGYVILLTARRSQRPRDFVIARFSRLYPTYWVCLTLSWVVVLAAGVAGLQRSGTEIAVNYSMVQRMVGVRSVDGAYWSLSVEIVFYAIVGAFLLTRGKIDPPAVRRLVPVWLGLSLVVAVVTHARPDSRFVQLVGIVSVAEYAALFCTGMLLLETRRNGRLEPLLALSLGAGFAVTWLMRGLTAAVVVSALTLLFAGVVTRPRFGLLRWRPLVFVGEISYPLYLLHQNIGYVVIDRLVGQVDRTIASLVAVAVAVALAWLVHVGVERPASRTVRRTLTRCWGRTSEQSTPRPGVG